jgi:hypothetical protein
MPVVAFDDILFQRHGTVGTFKAPMGIALTVLDEKRFVKNYDQLLDGLFIKYNSKRLKRIYKAAHLVGQLLDKSTDFIDDFIAGISKSIARIDVFYSYFPSDIVPRIYVFKDTHGRWYVPERFISLIQNSYVHICVWRYLQLHPDCKDYTFQADYFEGKTTPAWENIRDLGNLHLYNSGSECNCFISSADLILRHIQNKLNGPLVQKSICQCFDQVMDGTHIDANWLGPRKEFLNNIAPNKDIDANVRPKIKHPILIIAWQSYTSRSEDRDTFEWTPSYSKIMELAFKLDGCVRFWDPRSGPHFVKEDEDVVVVANELAKPMVNSIRSVFPKIKIDESLKV